MAAIQRTTQPKTGRAAYPTHVILGAFAGYPKWVTPRVGERIKILRGLDIRVARAIRNSRRRAEMGRAG